MESLTGMDPGAPASDGVPTASHGSPLFDFLTSFAPRKLKDLFRLCEYLYFNSAQIFAALGKYATLPVTSIEVKSENKALVAEYTRILTKGLKVPRVLIRAAIDKHVYGNEFISLYRPFVRRLKCGGCQALTNIQVIPNYRMTLKDLTFTYDCPHCQQRTAKGTIDDLPLKDPKLMNIIRWDPKLMDIDYNPITGQSVYYWTIPRDFKERVEKGARHLIDTTPVEFLRAMSEKDNETFRFAPGAVFHMKMDAPAGIEAQWGFPPLASTIKLFFYAAVLRRANEAIALDYVVPFRIVSPKQPTANSDPTVTISLQKWAAEMKFGVRRWRRDPLHIMWSPIPAEVTHLGGQARALMTLGEVQAAEDNIIAALGLPKEFIYGGLSALSGSSVLLRILENQLLHQTNDLNDLLQWIADGVAEVVGLAQVEVGLVPFKLMDDTERKQLLLNVNSQTGGQLSRKTMTEGYGVDVERERAQRAQEIIDDARQDLRTQAQVQKLQQSITTQAQSGAGGMNYDQQQMIAQADQMVQELSAMDAGHRQSTLVHLKNEDMVMYSVVKVRLEDAKTQEDAAALAAARNGGGAPGAAPGGGVQ